MAFDLNAFEKAKKASVAQLLFKCARLVNEMAVARVRLAGRAPEFRVSHTHLFPHIDFQGTRLTVLAERLGVTKQAAGQWVTELEQMGVLEKIPDPSDGRAKLIRFSEFGKTSMVEGLSVLNQVEGELKSALGPEKFGQFHQTLLALESYLEAPHQTNPGSQ